MSQLSSTNALQWIDERFQAAKAQPGFDVHGDWGVPAQAKAALEAVAEQVCF